MTQQKDNLQGRFSGPNHSIRADGWTQPGRNSGSLAISLRRRRIPGMRPRRCAAAQRPGGMVTARPVPASPGNAVSPNPSVARLAPGLRDGMGVEPTAASFALPATDFEDQGAHRDTCHPIRSLHYSRLAVFGVCGVKVLPAGRVLRTAPASWRGIHPRPRIGIDLLRMCQMPNSGLPEMADRLPPCVLALSDPVQVRMEPHRQPVPSAAIQMGQAKVRREFVICTG